ncbi:ROK family protein [Herbinix luporum]|jgi:glucokinase-like ROK family protein|uniref:ROK family protein n=1 Tax=Herbinix luporum TaxID=1679721 RepID=UPI001771E9C7|nr:ROK family protein [Herbinix luporum]MDI9488273.1 ROK family protein [Bacillota bacterium]HHT57768.1 ROK family protein [Herbinix luporum]
MRVLALDIGGTSIKIGIINKHGEILESSEVPTFAKEGGEVLINRVLDIIGRYDNIDRIGISATGQVDPIEGKIIFATDNIPGWTGIEIKRRIEEKYKIPTAVENDVNAAALGEAYFGAAIGNESFLCLTYGTGVGGAIIEKGEIYRGNLNSAGEFGHIITHVGGRDCTCGGKGCYETYASTTSLVRQVKEKLGMEDVNGRIIFDYLNKGNHDIKNIVDKWLQEVIMGLVSLIHIFNPSLIVLGGGIMSQTYIIDYIRENLPNYVMPNYKEVKVVQASLGNNAGILGAAHLAMKAKPRI